MTKIKYVEIIAPFNGFYNTIHGGKVDYMAEIYNTDDEGVEIKEDNTDYQKTRIEYCKNWVNNLSSEIGSNHFLKDFIKDIDLKFKNLESPKFYNFENDRLVMEIDTISIQKIQDIINKDYSEELEAELKERFTSCSGFTSFYPNNTREFLLHKEDCNTRAVYFEIFLKCFLDIEDKDLQNLVEDVEIVFNEN